MIVFAVFVLEGFCWGCQKEIEPGVGFVFWAIVSVKNLNGLEIEIFLLMDWPSCASEA